MLCVWFNQKSSWEYKWSRRLDCLCEGNFYRQPWILEHAYMHSGSNCQIYKWLKHLGNVYLAVWKTLLLCLGLLGGQSSVGYKLHIDCKL